jgi:hypothetical protein
MPMPVRAIAASSSTAHSIREKCGPQKPPEFDPGNLQK